MSLDTLVNEYRKKQVRPDIESPVETINRAEKTFDLATKENISTDEAESIVLTWELTDAAKKQEMSPLYQQWDSVIDTFDPSEPPKMEEEGVPDPMGTILKKEVSAVKTPVKWALKASSYLYSPISRALKFLTNATMYEPLTKASAPTVRKAVLNGLVNNEIFKRVEAEKLKIRKELKLPPSGSDMEVNTVLKQRQEQIRNDVLNQMQGIIEAEEADIANLPQVKAGDFAESTIGALKSLVPWPGFADDVKSTGEIASGSFERIVGREAPWYYAPLTDTAVELTALSGLLKVAQSAQLEKEASSIAAGAKLTRQEVKAIKKLHKAQSKTVKIPIKSAVPASDESATATQKLIQLIKDAKPLRKKKELLLHQDRQKKARKLLQVQKNIRGERLVKATKSALVGKSPVPDFTPINAGLTSQEIDTLFNLINTSKLAEGFDKGRAFLSLDKLLKGNLLTKSETANLEVVFGKQLTKALFRKQSVASIIQDVSYEVINLPRAILASYDLSAPSRQGIIFSVSHPIASTKAFGRSVRAAANLQYADDIERVTRASKFGQLGDKFGIHSSPTGFAAKLSAKEELYMSRIAEKIPGVAQSERAFTTFLNQQRREVFATQAKKWIARGITPQKNPESYRQLAKFINHATGRGSMEGMKPGALTALNALFFSPRFQISRVQVMGDLIKPSTTIHARKVIARDLAEFYATGMGMMAVAKAGGAEVETDPRSSDFGKIKVGNTRYNYWGAFQPLASLAGRIYSGEIKQTGTKKVKQKDRIEILGNFLRTKLAPVPARTIDALVGETILGQPVEVTKEFIGKASYESLVPLFIQDSVDAWRYQGFDAQLPISATLAFTGIGVQTWELAPFAELELARDSLARQTFGKNYDELSFIESNMLDTDILVNHPGIVELEQKTKFESEGVNFLKRQAKELRKSERFLEKHIDKKLLTDLNNMQIRLGGVERTFGNWRLSDEQYKEYQLKVAQNINTLFKDMRPVWNTNDSNPATRIEIMTRILRSAKQLAAQEIKIGDIE